MHGQKNIKLSSENYYKLLQIIQQLRCINIMEIR